MALFVHLNDGKDEQDKRVVQKQRLSELMSPEYTLLWYLWFYYHLFLVSCRTSVSPAPGQFCTGAQTAQKHQ